MDSDDVAALAVMSGSVLLFGATILFIVLCVRDCLGV